MTKTNAQLQNEWYHRMDDEEKRAHNQARYNKYKDKYNARSKQWALDNPHKSQAAAHNGAVKNKYPDAFSNSNITNKDLSEWVLKHRNCECVYCGRESTHIDHIVPLSKGGEHQWSNIQMICKTCNLAKADQSHEEYMDWIASLKEWN